MQFRAVTRYALPALLSAALLGCGSSSAPGTMNVHLVDGPDGTYDGITLQVKKLEIHGPTGWETLADFSSATGGVLQVDLLKLRDGISETLVNGKALPEGHYDQMRMLLGAGNSVTLAGTQTAIPLKVPSGMQSGVKFPVSFDVAPNTTRDVFIDFDAHKSIFVHEAGHSGKYLLRPVVRAVDRLVTGAITGKLTASAGGAPLPGVEVMAEVVQGGRPVVLRSALTTATGDYVLDLLPTGASYQVVAQPVVGTTVFAPKASGPIAIGEATPTPRYDAAFDAVAPAFVGTVSGTIQPAITSAEQSDTVVVLGSFAGTTLIVRAESAAVTSTGETYQVRDLPIFDGGYTLAVERGTVDASGATTVSWTVDGGTPILATGATSLAVVRNLTVAP